MEQSKVFAILSKIDVSGRIEKKGDLNYLSWSWAWSILKENFPGATYTVYENANGLNYHTDGRTCWVKTGVTVEGVEYIEYLPVMNFYNKSIPVESVTSTDVNKAIQRSLTKAIARHGLGLYIYAGEDLPDIPEEMKQPAKETKKAATTAKPLQGAQSQAVTNKAPQNAEKPAQQPVTVTQEDISKAYAYVNGSEKVYNNCVTKFMLAGPLKGTADDFNEEQMREIAVALKEKHMI